VKICNSLKARKIFMWREPKNAGLGPRSVAKRIMREMLDFWDKARTGASGFNY
jgi:hypothetical protein